MMRRICGLAAAGVLAAAAAAVMHQDALSAQANDGVITGAVTSAGGAEAGVWVIAETDDLETVFRKIVVTGDDGRFLLPELPAATYDVWVRGYGLVDSTPVEAAPGAELDLRATVAATPQRSTPPTTGSPSSTCRTPTSSPAPGKPATASTSGCRARTSGSTC